MTPVVARLLYGVSQSARFSWFFGQKMLAARLSEPEPAPAELRGRMPGTARLLRDLGALLRQDLANIEAGVYALPADLADNPVAALRRARLFFADLEAVGARRRAQARVEVREAHGDSGLPPYYLQNFHYQTDGYLSSRSAELYDHQVEVLFGGGADAMRRQALPVLKQAIARSGPRGARLLDIGCGTGRFLREVKANFPRLAVTGLDLSPFYLAKARESLAPWSRTNFLEAPAEAIPEPDASFDAASIIYLFHELPMKLRRQVAAEAARVLKPGGTLILVDSLQHGDVPDYDALLDYFPIAFHEPYFANYLDDDLNAVFADAGLLLQGVELAYFSKVMSFRKGPLPTTNAPGAAASFEAA